MKCLHSHVRTPEPLTAPRRHAGCEKQRQAVTPSRACSLKAITVCPWRRSSRCPGETRRLKFGVSPGHRAEPPPPAAQEPGTLRWLEVWFAALNGGNERAQVTNASRGRPGSRRHGLCGKRPTAQQGRINLVRSDKNHFVRHKAGRGEGEGRPRRGTPRDPAGRFMPHKVFLSYGRGSTGRAVTPPAAPASQLEKSGA